MTASTSGKAKKGSLKDQTDRAALILEPYLYLGPRSAASASFLTSHGITHVLSVGATPESFLPSVTYERLSLTDSPSANIAKVSDPANAFIESAKGGRILVHCSAAVSRSPTIVTAYLMSKCDMTLKEALGLLFRARPTVCPNPGFLRQLKEMEVALRGECTMEGVDALPAKKSDRQKMFSMDEQVPCAGGTLPITQTKIQLSEI